MKNKLLILFDLDGTLIDTAPEMHKALNNLLTEQGIGTVSYEEIRPLVSHGVQGFLFEPEEGELLADYINFLCEKDM